MKKNIQLALLAMGLLAFYPTGFAAEVKIATIDMQKVFESYYKTVQARIAVSNDVAEVQNGHKSMVDTYNQKKEDWQKALDRSNEQDISQDEREKSKKDAQNIMAALQEMETDIRGYDAREENRLSEKGHQRIDVIVGEIRDVLKDLAKREGYNLVLDSSGKTSDSVPVLLYSSGVDDLTDELIKQLNAAAPAPPPAGTTPPPASTPNAK